MQIRFVDSEATHIIFSWAFLSVESEGKSDGPCHGTAKTRYPRRNVMLSRWRVNTGRFPGRESNAGRCADKEVNAYECGQSKSRRESRFRSAQFAPGPPVWTRAGLPRPNAHPLAPRFVPFSFHRALPRRSALIPSYLGTHHATGCLFSVSLPRRRGGAASFNISRRPPPREFAGSHSPRTPSLLGFSLRITSLSRVHLSARALSR